MKRFVLGISLLIALANNLSAQYQPTNFLNDVRFKKITDGTSSTFKAPEIQGTPYLEDKFSPGRVMMRDSSFATDIALRYNAFSDNLEFRKGDDLYNIDPRTIVKRAEFGGRIFECLSFYENGKINNGNFEVLTKGKAALLARYTIKFMEKEKRKAFDDPKPDRYTEVQKFYFIAIGDAPAQKFVNKKGLLELFGVQSQEMETFISKNKLSIRKDDDLIKIVAHYNLL